MNIYVLATASSKRGALGIYLQFLRALSKYHGQQNNWYVLIDKGMPQIDIPRTSYVEIHTKGLNRVIFDLFGFNRLIKNNLPPPDVLVSFQNTCAFCANASRNVVYYHQPLSLYTYRSFKNGLFNKTFLFYHYFYYLYVKLLMNSRTYVAVQTETIKNLFVQKFRFSQEKVGVYFPDIELEDADKIERYQFGDDKFHFVYPAISEAYKEHVTLAIAMRRIYELNPRIADKVIVHFTIDESSASKALLSSIKKYGLQKNFVFHGEIVHQDILRMMKSSRGLLFPSVIESLGLPLLEAASLGIPIIANDLDYVRDVLSGYDGCYKVNVHDYDCWAEMIVSCCEHLYRYQPYTTTNGSSWPRLFQLILNGDVC